MGKKKPSVQMDEKRSEKKSERKSSRRKSSRKATSAEEPLIPSKSSSSSSSSLKSSRTVKGKRGHRVMKPENLFLFPKKPKDPTYGVVGSVFSILSLVLMSSLSTIMYFQLKNPKHDYIGVLDVVFYKPTFESGLATWVLLPFLFTIIGSTIGWVFELLLLITGNTFQQGLNSWTRFVRQIRLLNLAPVTTTIIFFVISFVASDAHIRAVSLVAMVALTFALGPALFLGGAEAVVPIILLGTQLLQIVLVLGGVVAGGSTSALYIGFQGVSQFIALIITTATPWRSFGFHMFSTLSGVLLYNAVAFASNQSPSFTTDVAVPIQHGSVTFWGIALSAIIGWSFVMKSSPKTYNILRSHLSNALWSLQYFLLVSAPVFPQPKNLSELYQNKAPEAQNLLPYYKQHPKFLMKDLAIPSVTKVEDTASTFSDLYKKVVKTFNVIALLDHFFPQADVKIPLASKPRMNIWDDGSEIYPQLYTMKLFGLELPIRHLEETPKAAIKASESGRLLAYLAQSGVANPFLHRCTEEGHEGQLVIDFRHLEALETKKDYMPYGGVAYFRLGKTDLELVGVKGPGSDDLIAPKLYDPAFLQAESQITASLYFEVIAGKHLGEIHMTYNLVEASMHNAFDAHGDYNHPFRTFMYIHLFSHELAEELTTEHLVQEGAVFSQIFATTHNSLVDYLNSVYHRFEYASDEDFEGRKEIMTLSSGDLPDTACIKWELEYREIWLTYAEKLIDTIYERDEDVAGDEAMGRFHDALTQALVKHFPRKYEDLKTKRGLVLFVSDTIHHLVIRHQVYGTTAVKAAMNPMISNTQVPRDSGTPGVDEWRSLISVALATARARFTTLVDGFKTDRWFYLIDGVEKKYHKGMKEAFAELQTDLEDLEERFTSPLYKGDKPKEFNDNYFRPIPSALHTGPGY